MQNTGRPGELSIPVPIESAEQPLEMLSAWAANDSLYCSIRPDPWKGHPEYWGIVLADVAKHVANAIKEESGAEAAATIALIQSLFNKECARSTSIAFGGFVEDDKSKSS
jgi:hypothetical protein